MEQSHDTGDSESWERASERFFSPDVEPPRALETQCMVVSDAGIPVVRLRSMNSDGSTSELAIQFSDLHALHDTLVRSLLNALLALPPAGLGSW